MHYTCICLPLKMATLWWLKLFEFQLKFYRLVIYLKKKEWLLALLDKSNRLPSVEPKLYH